MLRPRGRGQAIPLSGSNALWPPPRRRRRRPGILSPSCPSLPPRLDPPDPSLTPDAGALAHSSARGGTGRAHQSIKEGGEVKVSGPSNEVQLREMKER